MIYLPKYNKENHCISVFQYRGLSGNNRWIWRLTPLLNSATQAHLIDRDEKWNITTEVFQNKQTLRMYKNS
jgi:hypothetical protein